MSLKENYLSIKKSLPTDIKLVAVSKTKPASNIFELYELGHREFGENRVQELVNKYEELPKDIKWHMIGHLQINKVKYIAPFIHMIHSVDSYELLKEINKRALQVNRMIDCMLEIHIAKEESKFGMIEEQVISLLENEEYKKLNNIRIVGLMGIATNTEDFDIVKNEFEYLKILFDKIKNNFFINNEYFKEISMGMSNDYQIAIMQGSTIVRIGSLIFGERDYL